MMLTIKIGFFAFINIILGFIFQWYFIIKIGPGEQSDALIASMLLPQITLAVITGSLTYVLIPILVNSDENEFYNKVWINFYSIGALFISLSLLLFVTAKYWVPLTVPGFSPTTIALTVRLTYIQLLSLFFTAITSVLWSANHAKKKFIWVEISAIIASTVSFAFLILCLPSLGIFAVAWAMTLKSISQMILLLSQLESYSLPRWDIAIIRETWYKLRPLLFGSAYYKTDIFVDRLLTSMAPVGSMTLFNMACQLYGAAILVLNKSLASPMVPYLSTLASTGDWTNYRRVFFKRLTAVMVLTLVSYFVILALGDKLLALLFYYKSFGANDVETLHIYMISLVGLWVGGAVGQIFSCGFYAQGDTSTPTRVGIIGYTASLFFKFCGFYFGGILGLAIGTTVTYLFTLLLHSVYFKKQSRRVQYVEESV